MAAKNNLRSVRLSDETLEAIEAQIGRNFTEKLENMIARCMWELPATEEKLKELQDEISKKRQQLYDLQTTTEKLRRLSLYINNAEDNLKLVMHQAKIIAEDASRGKT